MSSIVFFCSAREVEEKYLKPATKLAELVAKEGYEYVWGGSDVGLMNKATDAAQKAGARVVGVTIPMYKQKARENSDEMIVAKDLSERKRIMLERADAFVVLVGGVGTIDEISEILEFKKQGVHKKPIVFLNTDNFYEGFKIQLEKMHKEGFLTRDLDELVFFADNPESAMKYIKGDP